MSQNLTGKFWRERLPVFAEMAGNECLAILALQRGDEQLFPIHSARYGIEDLSREAGGHHAHAIGEF